VCCYSNRRFIARTLEMSNPLELIFSLSLSTYLYVYVEPTLSLSLFRIEIGNVRESGNSCGSREVFEILDVKSLLSKLGTSLLFSVVTHVHIIVLFLLLPLLLLTTILIYVCTPSPHQSYTHYSSQIIRYIYIITII